MPRYKGGHNFKVCTLPCKEKGKKGGMHEADISSLTGKDSAHAWRMTLKLSVKPGIRLATPLNEFP